MAQSIFMSKVAVITGVEGQDGSYLKELLDAKGYSVRGVDREDGDVTDREFVRALVKETKPDEFYNLASIATVARPWDKPLETIASTGLAPLYMLEAIKEFSPRTRFFQASSAEMYGAVTESPQGEHTPFRPQNLYGIGKLMAHNLLEAYRRDQKLFAVSGILFNHESPRRREEFVTRKITNTFAKIKKSEAEELVVGNVNAKRDWTHAKDTVRAMWMSLQAEKSDSYVIASGAVHTVREFIEAAAKVIGMTLTWEGEAEGEVARDEGGKVRARVSPEFYRPVETHVRQGDISKIQRELTWRPEISFENLVREMVESDVS